MPTGSNTRINRFSIFSLFFSLWQMMSTYFVDHYWPKSEEEKKKEISWFASKKSNMQISLIKIISRSITLINTDPRRSPESIKRNRLEKHLSLPSLFTIKIRVKQKLRQQTLIPYLLMYLYTTNEKRKEIKKVRETYSLDENISNWRLCFSFNWKNNILP